MGERILADPGHTPSTMSSARHPASSTGVDVLPVMAPIPALYVKPIIAGLHQDPLTEKEG